MADLLYPPDYISDIIKYLTETLPGLNNPTVDGVIVADAEPDMPAGTFPPKLIVVADSGSAWDDLNTALATVKIASLAETEQDARELSQIVQALIRNYPVEQPDNTITSIDEIRGLFPATENQHRHRYFSLYTIKTVLTIKP